MEITPEKSTISAQSTGTIEEEMGTVNGAGVEMERRITEKQAAKNRSEISANRRMRAKDVMLYETTAPDCPNRFRRPAGRR